MAQYAQTHTLQVGNRNAILARQRARARQIDIKRHVDNAELLAGITPAWGRKTRLHHIDLAAQATHDGLALVVEIAYRHDFKSQRRFQIVDARPHRQRLAPRAHHRHAQAHGTAIARRASGTAQRVLGLPHDRARVVHQQCAGRRHFDARVRAFEQRDAELGLEARHLLDERRSRHAQLCRRTREASQLRSGRYGLKSSIVHVNLPFSRPWPHGATGGCFRRSCAQLRINCIAQCKPMVNAILTNMQFTCANAKHTITSENHVGRLMGATHREA